VRARSGGARTVPSPSPAVIRLSVGFVHVTANSKSTSGPEKTHAVSLAPSLFNPTPALGILRLSLTPVLCFWSLLQALDSCPLALHPARRSPRICPTRQPTGDSPIARWPVVHPQRAKFSPACDMRHGRNKGVAFGPGSKSDIKLGVLARWCHS